MKKLRIGLIVDDSEQSYLNFDLYRRSLDSNYYSIECLVIQKIFQSPEDNVIYKIINLIKRKKFKSFIDQLGFKFIDKIENQIANRKENFKKFFVKHNLSEFNVPKVYVKPIISASGLVYRYHDDDLNKIRDLNLDALVRGGNGILRGKVLHVCRLGIISFHHANNDINRGGPPGFWEVYNREASTGFVIQRLLPELDGGDIFFKGSISTSLLYKINICRLYIKSSVFLHKTLERLSINTENRFIYPKVPYAYPLYKIPTNSQVISYVIRTILLKLKIEVGKIIGQSYRWSVAYQFTKEWKSAVLWKSKLIKNPPYRFLADPFVTTKNNRTVIFVEDYDYRTDRGKISAFEIDSTGYKELGVALEEDFHLSYPFLLNVAGKLYMVPETHESKDIRIYKCVDFPLKWELHKVIMEDISSSDSNIFKFGDKYWLITNTDSSELYDHGSELHIFYAEEFDSSQWHPHPMNPVIFDSNCGRNGGLILSDGHVYRVFQKQGFNMYGSAMGVSKISILTTEYYEEEILFEIAPKFFKNIKGTHTFSFDSGVLCLDYAKYESYRK